MGTNYYRIPTEKEIETRKQRLLARVDEMPVTPSFIERDFRFIDDPNEEDESREWPRLSPWDEFTNDVSIHLGKRSSGWKFCWNFHNNKYYQDKASLLAFIRSGRVVDEYGTEWPVEEFIAMALTWGEPAGLVADKEYFDKNPHPWISNPEAYYDREIDGLRVSSSTEFS